MVLVIIDFKRFKSHMAEVTLQFTSQMDAPIISLPNWIAGSYLIRDFAKHITAVEYQIDGTHHRAIKSQKNHWQLPAVKRGDSVVVSYEVYCHDLSVRAAYVDSQRIFGNFTSLVMMITGHDKDKYQVTLSVPEAFYQLNPDSSIACGLSFFDDDSQGDMLYHLEAVDAFELYDYPFEIAVQTSFDFSIRTSLSDNLSDSVRHRFFVSGTYQMDDIRLKRDLSLICQTYADKLGWLPFNEYTFMTYATGDEYGGLEHINSTALITPRSDLPSHYEGEIPSGNYQRFLGLCSHEYFHSWWVKSVRPSVMMDNDLQSEGYTTLLWVFEGFTSYIDNLMLYVSGVIDEKNYLALLANDITRFYNTEGRHHQSVAESSFDAWIKLYQPNANSPNRTISYYNKGTLIALCLDLLLLKRGHRLFDVIKHFSNLAKQSDNKRFGMTENNLSTLLSEMLGADTWQHFYDNYIIGTAELPLVGLLEEQGINLINDSNEYKAWGLTVDGTPAGLVIKQAHPDSPAVAAGLSVGDTIIAIEGLKADKACLLSYAKLQQKLGNTVKCHAFRRDELLTFDIVADSNNPQTLATVHKAVLKNPTGITPDWLAFA